MSSSTLNEHRLPAVCAEALDATAAEINLMSMEDRLLFVQAMRAGAATKVGAGDRWFNIEGVIAFFRDHELGAPGTWVSWVNAGVLEGIERGLASTLDPEASDYGNAGAPLWADYINRHRSGQLPTRNNHDRAWGEAKEVGTDYGILLAEQGYGTAPTPTEKRFLLCAQIYNWAMRNRPLLDVAVTYGPMLDSRIKAVRPDFVDWFISVGSVEAAQKGCEIAWAAAQIDPTPETFAVLKVFLNEIPQLIDVYRSGRSA